MAILNFPTRPGGTLGELWSACLELVQQLESLSFTTIHEKTIGTTETAVAHGQRYKPSIGIPVPRTNVAVWPSSQPDEKYCYFTAASPVVVDVKVFR